jgi:hypothetical protein
MVRPKYSSHPLALPECSVNCNGLASASAILGCKTSPLSDCPGILGTWYDLLIANHVRKIITIAIIIITTTTTTTIIIIIITTVIIIAMPALKDTCGISDQGVGSRERRLARPCYMPSQQHVAAHDPTWAVSWWCGAPRHAADLSRKAYILTTYLYVREGNWQLIG